MVHGDRWGHQDRDGPHALITQQEQRKMTHMLESAGNRALGPPAEQDAGDAVTR